MNNQEVEETIERILELLHEDSLDGHGCLLLIRDIVNMYFNDIIYKELEEGTQ